MKFSQKIAPFLWFNDQAEVAANCYVGIFRNSRITAISRYSEAGQEVHGGKPGSVLTVAFELEGLPFVALNGGPVFTFNEAISFQVFCDAQDEVDYYWARLSAGGPVEAQQCGWLKDRFGVSWQVVPAVLPDLLGDHRSDGSKRAMEAMLKMKKLDIAALEQAYAG